MTTRRQRQLSLVVIGLALAGSACLVRAADEVAWTGSVSLPELLDAPRAIPLEADPGLQGCLRLVPSGDAAALLRQDLQAQERLRIAGHFFRAYEAEEDENLGTERVAASYGRFTRAADKKQPDAAALELLYLQALSGRDAARIAHHEARLQLGFSAGSQDPVGKALDTENLAWPRPPQTDAGGASRQALSQNPRLRALRLLQAHFAGDFRNGRNRNALRHADCLTLVTQQTGEQTRQVALAVLQNDGALRHALDSRQRAARLQLANAERALDEVRERLAQEPAAGTVASGHGTSTASLHDAQIATAEAVAGVRRVRDDAVLASLRLQALAGLRPTP